MKYQLPAPKRAQLDFRQFEKTKVGSETIERPCAWTLLRASSTGDDIHRTPVSNAPVTVGRDTVNNLFLADPTVSGTHAELRVVNGELILSDLASTNGTFRNGKRVCDTTVLHHGDVIHFGQAIFTVEETVQQLSANEDWRNKTCVTSIPDNAVLYQGFESLLSGHGITPHFQPIVTLAEVKTIGYEILIRSNIRGLKSPDEIFKIAAMRMAEARFSEVCRTEGLLNAMQLDRGSRYFLNTHATELETPQLIESLRQLRNDFPHIAIVLEIHEAAITSVKYLTELVTILNDMEIELAFDDFGAGQARLIELFEVPPKYLKFDLSLVRGLENASRQHRASVSALIKMVHDLNVTALAEGVETQNQADICTELGFDTAQGYFFGRPNTLSYWQEKLICGQTQALPNAPLVENSLTSQQMLG